MSNSSVPRCDSNSAPAGAQVPGFESSDQLRCGISFPQQAYPGLTNMSSCCSGPINVWNSCFHFCDAEDMDEFNTCTRKNVFNNTGGNIVSCNDLASSAGSTASGNWKVAVLVGLLGAVHLVV